MSKINAFDTTSQAPSRTRINSIDAMRGIVMVLMMFDHVRETFFLHQQVSDPMDVSQTPPDLFFTRLAAHLCAPVFVFLTGLSAFLYANPASGPRDASGFLIKRGLLLIALELVVVNFAWSGTFPPPVIYLQVIWVIGLSMIVLGMLHQLPLWVLAVTGILIVGGHNALDTVSVPPGGIMHALWTLLLHRGYLINDAAIKLKVSYPLLPWIGIILLGYVAGRLYASNFTPLRRQRLLLQMGCVSLCLFMLLRSINLYGETLQWESYDNALLTVMSFLNLTKYPPSLDFALLTLGITMCCLHALEKYPGKYANIASVFGGAPMFYYLLHLYILLLLQNVLSAIAGANFGKRFDVEYVWQIWLISVALIPVLYFPCRAFARYKRHSQQAWVRYF
ncbi:DUF1624 domain-containing protein [Undibacterium sp. 14-3-2]|uniref:DUF1624 domain-containing protein n=1 Tax=Undibacterium sp. 14-3-2 TaxID=2800129 RepID=UPI001908089C|nr:heparan-alpha-glucosaminide N-acetyltransferase domain-containing protein [Undibacterium sp. 14-3-2]MBK1891266.1 DUF1624 domain-containing protein [Undibacterium sp. 14-3-2]